jgi:F-type H+-transporting ATPase subunit b
MQLDGFTTAAQIVNFLILVALLKRFLYGPIIEAMDSREAHIAARLQEAEVTRDRAAQQTALYHERLQQLQETRETMLVQAREEAEAQRQQLLAQARQEAQQTQMRWHQTLRQEQASFLQELRQHAGHQVCAVARHALAELAHADLEAAVTRVFLERLRDLNDEARHTLATAAHQTQGVVVRSAFPLPVDLQQQIIRAVHDHLAADVGVQFATEPALLCGIELETLGQKVSWHLTHYLNGLEEQVMAMMRHELEPEAAITT